MRTAVLALALPFVLMLGCKKQAAESTAQPVPPAVLASFGDETPPSASRPATSTPSASTPPPLMAQSTPEPQKDTKSGVEKTLQRNQQILEGLVHRLVTSQPSAECGPDESPGKELPK